MPTIISNGGSLTIRKPQLTEFDFQLDIQEQTVVVEQGSLVDAVDGDANVKRSTESTIENRFVAGVVQTVSTQQLVAISTTGNGSVSGAIVSRTADGDCQIFAKHAWLKRRADVVFARTGGQTSDSFSSYRTGSLAGHIKNALVSAATGKTTAALPVFSTQNHDANAYVRNVDCWLSGINLTAVSPWNSSGGIFMAGVAISKRHVMFARHYTISNGATLRFITQDNQVITRTLTASAAIAEAVSLAVDIGIGLLDSDLPDSITPVKVFPSNIASYLPTVSKYYVPTFAFDFEEKVITKDLRGFENDGTVYRCSFSNCLQPPLSTLTESIISGDSGNPVFTLVNGEAILLGCWISGGGGTSSAAHMKISEINAAMTTLGGGYQLTTVDLSGFNFYG